MKLYGSTTSPFVRRVRVVAAEAGASYEWIDVTTEAGLAAVKQVSPIWKWPVAELDGRVIFDSRAIIDWLATTRGLGGLAAARDRFLTGNHVNAIDAALEAAIAVFYLRRDGVATAGVAVAEKNLARVGSILDWLGGEVTAGRLGSELGIAEVSLLCTLDWLEFRDLHPVGRHAALAPLRAAHRDRPSLASTRPA